MNEDDQTQERDSSPAPEENCYRVEVLVTKRDGVYYADFSDLDAVLDELFGSEKSEEPTDA